MPKLDTPLHLEMFRNWRRRRSISSRLRKAVDVFLGRKDLYGLEWGDPDVMPPLRYVRDHFLIPYISPQTTVLEIGPGGGRWTRYMLNAGRIYAVDYYQEILDEHRNNFKKLNIVYILNNGDDFPGIPAGTINFVFSFGLFVHLDLPIIDAYLRNMKPLLAQGASVVLQYSDYTKPMARKNEGFSKNDPDTMRELVLSHNYSIYEEDTKTMWHSSVVRFGLRKTPTLGSKT